MVLPWMRQEIEVFESHLEIKLVSISVETKGNGDLSHSRACGEGRSSREVDRCLILSRKDVLDMIM